MASTVVVGDVLRGFVFAGVETVQHVCMYMCTCSTNVPNESLITCNALCYITGRGLSLSVVRFLSCKA